MSTSRLKRKAEYDPDLLQDNNLNESFVTYGTPLPSLASTKKDQGEYVPVWKQEVRDEKGRRRLHGAFTGGFSAGYFNTVGSKEGWAPSTFVSKKDREKGLASGTGAGAKPEDFMDEEDLAELKASRSFKTSEGFSGSKEEIVSYGQSAALGGAQDANYSSAVANSLKDLVKPSSSKIGQQMMLKMGWKPGQGVGPRIAYSRRQEILQELGTFSARQGDDEDDLDEAKKHMYAPVDRPLVLFEAKENQYGLGYVPNPSLSGGLRREAASRQGVAVSAGAVVEGRAMPTLSGGYGISALEDQDEDDADIYSSGAYADKSSGVLYLADDDDNDEMHPSAGMRRKPELMRWHDMKKGERQAQASVKQDTFRPRLAERFNDGTPVLPGFRLASRIQPPDKVFPTLPVPKGWEPNPKKIWDEARSKQEKSQATAPLHIPKQQKGKQNMLSADDRAQILGEPILPKSVFEYMSAKNKERLETYASVGKSAPVVSDPEDKKQPVAPSGPRREEEVTVTIPAIDPKVAQSALKGFMPYGDDLARQTRYKAYLSHHASLHDPSSPHYKYAPQPPSGRSIADLNKELQDFAHAALIFKPMSGMMANRFTSSSGSSTLLDIKAPEAGLRKPTPKPAESQKKPSDDAKQREIEEREKDDRDPRRVAIKAGQFGPLTRSTEVWYPARLLCKRFNVADPHPEGPSVKSADPYATGSSFESRAVAEKDVLNNVTMDELMRTRDANAFQGGFSKSSEQSPAPMEDKPDKLDTLPVDEPAKPLQEIKIPSVANVGLGEDESQGRDTLTYQKPTIDIFRAIFADSEDEDDENDEEDLGPKANGAGSVVAPSESVVRGTNGNGTTQFSTTERTAETEEQMMPLTVDSIATFKPTFKTKAERATDSGIQNKIKKKKKTTSAAIFSFDMDEDSESQGHLQDKHKPEQKGREKKKLKKDKSHKKKETMQVEDEDEWVEKAPPPSSTIVLSVPETASADGPKKPGRMRASELF